MVLMGVTAFGGQASIAAPSAPGPIQIISAERTTYGQGSINIPGQRPMHDRDEKSAPDQGPWFAEASGGVSQKEVSGAGITRHISSLDGRVLDADLHCDANANAPDTEGYSADGSCGNRYAVAFHVSRPAKVRVAGQISTARTGSAGGDGTIYLYDSSGNTLIYEYGTSVEIYELLNLTPGDYKLAVAGGASAYAGDFGQEFSAATADLRLTLTVRNR